MDTQQKASLWNRFKTAYRVLTYGSVWGQYAGMFSSTSAGISVNEHKALTWSAWWNAVRCISGDIGSSPLCLYRRLPNGGREKYTDHPIYELLHDAPNPEMASDVFKETMQGHILSWGNAYAEIERNGFDRPVALWPITPDRVQPYREPGDIYGPLKYRVSQTSGEPLVLKADDVLHIPGLGFDGYQGYSVVAMARQSIALALAAEQFGETFYTNKGHIGGIFSHPTTFAPGAQKVFEESVRAQTTGANAHNFITLQENMTYTPFGVPPNDAQFLETRKFSVTEVARWFNMPPHKLADLEHATFSNIEHLAIEYVTKTLRYWAVRWEKECNRKLISRAERKQQYFEHNLDALLRGDQEARFKGYALGRQWGLLTLNQIAAKENWNPESGEYGDTYLVPANMTTSDNLLKAPPPGTGTTPPAESQPAPKPENDKSRELLDKLQEVTERLGKAEGALETSQRDAKWLQLELKHREKHVYELEDRDKNLSAHLEAAKLKEAQLELMRDELAAECARLQTVFDEERISNLVHVDARKELDRDLAQVEQRAKAAEEEAETRKQALQGMSDALIVAELKASELADRVMKLDEGVRDATELAEHKERAYQEALQRAEATEAQLLIDRASLEDAQARILEIQNALEAAKALSAEERAARSDVERREQEAEKTWLSMKEAWEAAAAKEVIALEEARAALETAEQERDDARRATESAERGWKDALAELAKATESEEALRRDRALYEEELAKKAQELEDAKAELEENQRIAAEYGALIAEQRDKALAEATAIRDTSDIDRMTFEAILEEQKEKLAAAEQAVAESQMVVAKLEDRVRKSEEEREAADTDWHEAEVAREQALKDLEATRADLATERAAHAQASDEARAEVLRLETAIIDAEAQRTLIYEQGAKAAAEREQALKDLEKAKAEWEGERAKYEEDVKDLENVIKLKDDFARSDVEHERLLAQSTAKHERMRQIEANRELYIHELGRLIRRETSKAKSYGSTQQKLRTWKRNFYDSTEEDLFVQSLLPAMRIHLSAMGSAADPTMAVTTLVQAHFRQSQAELDVLLDGDQDQHATSLERLIERWEKERARKIAEALIQEELSYVSR